MDDDWDNKLFQGDDRADVYFTLAVKSRGSFIDEWKDGKNGGASIGKSKYPN
jgi:hypothetical protein